jgi:hypothetical protein
MKRVLAVALLVTASSWAQKDDPWKPFQALIGDWVGEGGGGPGQGGGGFSYQFDLQGNVIIRKNYAEYPAQNGRPAARHDDLMIVYLDDASKRPRAIYFDSEGHTIRYVITVLGDSLIFESEAGEPGAHYRLTQTPAGRLLSGKFEVRAPGEALYKTYIEFTARRK